MGGDELQIFLQEKIVFVGGGVTRYKNTLNCLCDHPWPGN